jgi:hypothetical protein
VEVEDQFPPHMMKMNEFSLPCYGKVSILFVITSLRLKNHISLMVADIKEKTRQKKVGRICRRKGKSDTGAYSLLASLTYVIQRLKTAVPIGLR